MAVKHVPPQEAQSFSSLTPEQLLAVELLSFLDEKSCRLITSRDIVEASKRNKSYSVRWLIHLFGSLADARSVAGIGFYTKRQRHMINQLYMLYHELECVPTSRDITEASQQKKCSSVRTIQSQFGSFNAYLEAARLPIRRVRHKNSGELPLRQKTFIRRFTTKNETVADLQFLTWLLGRRFTGAEVNRLSRLKICRSVRTYKRSLGVSTFEEALKIAICWEEDDVEWIKLQGKSLITVREIQEIFGITLATTEQRIRKGLWIVESLQHSPKGGRTGLQRLLGVKKIFDFWAEGGEKYYPFATVARNLKERRKFWEGDL